MGSIVGQEDVENTRWITLVDAEREVTRSIIDRRGMGEPSSRIETSYSTNGQFTHNPLSTFLSLSLTRPRMLKTSIASRALDGLGSKQVRSDVVAGLLKYLDTDTVWFVTSLLSILSSLPSHSY